MAEEVEDVDEGNKIEEEEIEEEKKKIEKRGRKITEIRTKSKRRIR